MEFTNVSSSSWNTSVENTEEQHNMMTTTTTIATLNDNQIPMSSAINYHHRYLAPHHLRITPSSSPSSSSSFLNEILGIQQVEEEEEEEEEELGAMKEMMYKIAAMQPVDIDPATIRKPKRRNVRISDDPQSVAARHRRERISERIRILQRLVPGGTKMDTASMLDEAIRYVKFLKRQIRLLQSTPPTNLPLPLPQSPNANANAVGTSPAPPPPPTTTFFSATGTDHWPFAPTASMDMLPAAIGFGNPDASSSFNHHHKEEEDAERWISEKIHGPFVT